MNSAVITASPAGDRAELLAHITAFDQWFAALYRQENPSLLAGVQLARRRRAALKELIAVDPAEALSRAIPRTLRAALPDEIRAQLETPFDTFGRFEVLARCFGAQATIERFTVIEGARYQTHTYGNRLAALTKDRLAVHGIAIDDRLALAEEAYRLLEPGEKPGGERNDPRLFVAIGDNVQAFASPDELAAWQRNVAISESTPGPATDPSAIGAPMVPTGWTVGEKRVLWIRVDYPDDPGLPVTDAGLRVAAGHVDQFFRENSRGRCTIKSTFFPGALRLPGNKSTYCDAHLEATKLARRYDLDHGGRGEYNPDAYDRWIVVSNNLPSGGSTGTGYIGQSGILIHGAGVHLAEVATHELGHNHGLYHSHAWAATVDAAIREENHVEYGDTFDTMGSVWAGESGFLNAHFNTAHKAALHYLDDANLAEVDQAGVYRLHRHDYSGATGVQAIRVPNGAYEYWLEHRQLGPRAEPRSLLDRLRSGVQVRWGRHPSYLRGAGTYLIDASPSSASFNDSPLAVGETFTDPERCVSVTPIALGGSSLHEWIDVRVAFGATGSNHNPELSVDDIPRVLSVRQNLSFQAVASDPDGDPVTCAWTFDTGHFPVQGLKPTFRYAVGGNYTISCSATDGRGGIATQRKHVIVDDPLRTWEDRSLSPAESLCAIIHDGRQFVAAGSVIATSTDGVAWTHRRIKGGGMAYDLVQGEGRYVAVGTLTTGQSPALTTAGAIFTSTDLVTWNVATLPETVPPLWSVAYGAQRFVAVGKGGTLLQSADGMTWQKVASGTARDLRDIRFAMGRFVTAGLYGTILTSTDGLTWQNRSVPLPDSLSMTAHGNKWIALAGVRIYISADGLNWNQHALSTSIGGAWITSLSGEVLISGRGLNEIYLSEDGLAWNPFQFAATNDHRAGIEAACSAADGTVVGVGFDGLIVRSSLKSQLSAAPVVTTPPKNCVAPAGESITFNVEAKGTYLTYAWDRNGVRLAGKNHSQLSLDDVQPDDAGLYSATVSNAVGIATSTAPVVFGLSLTKKLSGAAEQIAAGIAHPNGNIYDQVLLTGSAAALTAEHTSNKITRTSFVDLDHDIVQVELSGPGTLSIVLDGATPPAPPTTYNQPDVSYVRGHAGIVITGADERTNVSIFTVGRLTAVNQALFKPTVDYDGIADLAFVAISSTNGKFGGLRTANAHYFASEGWTGIYAPGVAFQGPLYAGDITAFDSAKPVLVVGSATDVRITGGDLFQDNGAAIETSGITRLRFTPGSDSHGAELSQKSNRGVLQTNGTDVTADIVGDTEP